MIKKYKITYRAVLKLRTVKIEATSKYNAKQRFYHKYPKYEIVKIEVAEHGEAARGYKKSVNNGFPPSVTEPQREGDVDERETD